MSIVLRTPHFNGLSQLLFQGRYSPRIRGTNSWGGHNCILIAHMMLSIAALAFLKSCVLLKHAFCVTKWTNSEVQALSLYTMKEIKCDVDMTKQNLSVN